MKRLFLWTLSLGISSSSLLCGCSQESASEQGVALGGVVAVEFSATKITTRVSGDNWSSGDSIGIFATSDDPTSTSYANVEYYVNSAETGGLTPAYRDNQILFEEGVAYDYVAYFPYNETVATSSISINLLDQSDITGLEVLRAEKQDVVGESVSLEFEHLLAKLSFEIEIDGDNSTIETLTECTLNFLGGALIGEYSFTNKQIENIVSGVSSCQVELPLTVASDGESATAEALVIPMESIVGTKIIITTAAGDVRSVTFGGDTADIQKWESGHIYNYEIKL